MVPLHLDLYQRPTLFSFVPQLVDESHGLVAALEAARLLDSEFLSVIRMNYA